VVESHGRQPTQCVPLHPRKRRYSDYAWSTRITAVFAREQTPASPDGSRGRVPWGGCPPAEQAKGALWNAAARVRPGPVNLPKIGQSYQGPVPTHLLAPAPPAEPFPCPPVPSIPHARENDTIAGSGERPSPEDRQAATTHRPSARTCRPSRGLAKRRSTTLTQPQQELRTKREGRDPTLLLNVRTVRHRYRNRPFDYLQMLGRRGFRQMAAHVRAFDTYTSVFGPRRPTLPQRPPSQEICRYVARETSPASRVHRPGASGQPAIAFYSERPPMQLLALPWFLPPPGPGLSSLRQCRPKGLYAGMLRHQPERRRPPAEQPHPWKLPHRPLHRTANMFAVPPDASAPVPL